MTQSFSPRGLRSTPRHQRLLPRTRTTSGPSQRSRNGDDESTNNRAAFDGNKDDIRPPFDGIRSNEGANPQQPQGISNKARKEAERSELESTSTYVNSTMKKSGEKFLESSPRPGKQILRDGAPSVTTTKTDTTTTASTRELAVMSSYESSKDLRFRARSME